MRIRLIKAPELKLLFWDENLIKTRARIACSGVLIELLQRWRSTNEFQLRKLIEQTIRFGFSRDRSLSRHESLLFSDLKAKTN
jgi:hypothetical protein